MPLSFVVVHFSDDLTHNLLQSPCVHDPLNERVIVDNRGNVRFDNLSQAILDGISRVRNDLVVVVHEDVLLLDGWQAALERSLLELQAVDPDWAAIGSAGWRADGRLIGHFSDPGGYLNTFTSRRFEEVDRIDEHLMVLRRSRMVPPDPALPSIHNIGRDIPLSGRRVGRRTYVIDAPTIHKFADGHGRPIRTRADSPKIAARSGYSWRADRACSDDYFRWKWQQPEPPTNVTPEVDPEVLDRPVVLLARGGGGSRLLSTLARDAGLFVGNEVNISGDTLELVLPIYKGILNRFRRREPWQRGAAPRELRAAAAAMLSKAGVPRDWGFKLPESMLLTEEILQAFPQARFIHMVRDPLRTCLRRTHMTARLDNEIGQVTLPAAYRHCGRSMDRILDEPPPVHMALTSIHQIETVLDFQARVPPERWLSLRFEDLLEAPLGAVSTARHWILGDAAAAMQAPPCLPAEVDPARAAHAGFAVAAAVEREVEDLLEGVRHRLGYLGRG